MSLSKKWGKREFWGVGPEYDPEWILTENQKILRDKLIEQCRVKIRPYAIHCDKTYEFPKKSIDVLGELGLLGLIIPKEFGGMGENHVCSVMVMETLARYGCPSTALIYAMHLVTCGVILFFHHNNETLKKFLIRITSEKLLGGAAYSDPAAGGHFWYAPTCKVKELDENIYKILKYSAWTTSAGFADWYLIQTLSPNFDEDYSNLSTFLVFKDEVRSSTDCWSSLGMHANQSGPMIIDGKFPKDRLIGPIGAAKISNNEINTSHYLLHTSACWNGISMACMDVAKKHVTRKSHADLGVSVSDYASIQDIFGECILSTNTCRTSLYFLAQTLDNVTNNNDWSIHKDINVTPRTPYNEWYFMVKYASSKNVSKVTDKMLQACGGTGYKTDLEVERLLRDGKAGWLMTLSNELIRQIIGKSLLLGQDSVDYWEQHCNEKILHHELSKMNPKEKRDLVNELLSELNEENKESNPYQDTDFDNPFNISPSTYFDKVITTADGTQHYPCLNPSKWVKLKLLSKCDLNDKVASFVFNLLHTDEHTGCLPGQYVQVRVNINGKYHERYFSPVSRPNDFGKMELVLKFETHGILSQYFKNLKEGDSVEFLGPCGGFEYETNKIDEVTLIASGSGVTPALQLIRCILNNPMDKTRIKLLYYSNSYEEILFKMELDSYEALSDQLKVIHSLGDVPEDWEGEEGFIDAEMIDKYVTKPDGIKHKIIMCGGVAMIISCLHSLRRLKFPSEIIFIYGQFGTEQIRTVYGRNVKLSGHKCDNVV